MILFYAFVTQSPNTRRLSFLAFLFYHILHCICLKIILFTESKYFVSNWSYTRLIRTFKTVKKSNKKFEIFRVIAIRYFIIQKLFRAINGFIMYQIKQTAIKSGNKFSIYNKFTHASWNEEFQTRKPLSYFCLYLCK